MSGILSYLPILLTLVVGLLGIFYSKTGEKQKVRRIGWVFASLLVIGALYGTYDIWSKAVRSKAESDARVDEKAAEKQHRTRLEQQAAMLNRGMELVAFDAGRPFTHGQFYFDIGLRDNGQLVRHPGFTGPFPNFGRAGMTGEAWFHIDGIFDYRYRLSGTASGEIQLHGDGPPLRLVPTNTACYVDAAGACAADDNASPGYWGIDGGGRYSHNVRLATNSSVSKMVSRAIAATDYGRLVFQIPGLTERDYQSALRSFAEMGANLQFEVPLANARGREGCASRIILPVQLRPAPESSARRIVILLVPGERRFDTFECGEDDPS